MRGPAVLSSNLSVLTGPRVDPQRSGKKPRLLKCASTHNYMTQINIIYIWLKVKNKDLVRLNLSIITLFRN